MCSIVMFCILNKENISLLFFKLKYWNVLQWKNRDFLNDDVMSVSTRHKYDWYRMWGCCTGMWRDFSWGGHAEVSQWCATQMELPRLSPKLTKFPRKKQKRQQIFSLKLNLFSEAFNQTSWQIMTWQTASKSSDSKCSGIALLSEFQIELKVLQFDTTTRKSLTPKMLLMTFHFFPSLSIQWMYL